MQREHRRVRTPTVPFAASSRRSTGHRTPQPGCHAELDWPSTEAPHQHRLAGAIMQCLVYQISDSPKIGQKLLCIFDYYDLIEKLLRSEGAVVSRYRG